MAYDIMKQISYGKQSIDEQDIKEVFKVLKSNWITQGPKIQEFEESLAEYCGVRYAVVVSSGTAALHLACLAAGLKKGDEAITSPITFLATANTVLYTNAKPVFADIDSKTANIDPKEIKKKITKNTRAILPVHFAGLPCDMPEIAKIARKHNLTVIEDACHALGAEYKVRGKWVKVGSCKHSDMTILSFHPVKHITTGEGGAITTNDRRIYERLNALRTHGVYKDKNTAKKGPWYYEMRELGFNYRITDFQCALGISQLKKIKKFIEKRRKIAEKYSLAFRNNEHIEVVKESKKQFNSYHLYLIKVRSEAIRLKLFSYLKKKNIFCQVHYIPVYWHPYYQRLGYKRKVCPMAENFYKRGISIPIYPSMNQRDANFVLKTIFNFFED